MTSAILISALPGKEKGELEYRSEERRRRLPMFNIVTRKGGEPGLEKIPESVLACYTIPAIIL